MISKTFYNFVQYTNILTLSDRFQHKIYAPAENTRH